MSVETDPQEILHSLGVPRIPLKFCGVQQSDIEDGSCSWVKNTEIGRIVQYPPDRKLPHAKWDTHDPHGVCDNCVLIKTNRFTKIWQCQGHPTE